MSVSDSNRVDIEACNSLLCLQRSNGRLWVLVLAGAVGSACSPCKDRAESPTPGTYIVSDAPDPELVGETAQIEGELLTLTYLLSDGSEWRVTYRIGEPLY